jgi:SRSO17 transposase
MINADLEALLPALERFHARFARFFRRSEGRAWSRRYLIGLALPIERKNVENIAERVGAPPRKLQEFLSESPWDDEGCIGELQRFVGEQLGAPGGVLVLDDTGFAKKGVHSAGVGRQYSGTLGRVDNCQVGVFLGYASSLRHTLVDRRLYLAEGWLADPTKRGSPRAAVPETVRFATKLELAGEMLTAAIERGHLPVGWVTADAAYGDSADLRALVASHGRWYCFEVSGTTEVWTAEPAWAVPQRQGRMGRPRTKARPGPNTAPAQAVRDVVRALPPDAWIRHRVTEGEKGPREYEFARLRVIEKVHRSPGQAGWLLARRPVGSDQGAEIKCYLSNAPATIALAEMAGVGCLRWTIEEDFELAKGEVGLDHYEVTKLRGWYHHITLSLLALAFLKAVQREWGKNGATASVPEVRRLLEVVLPAERWSASTDRLVRAPATAQGRGQGQPHAALAQRASDTVTTGVVVLGAGAF